MSITFVYYCYGNEAYTDLEVLSSGIVPTYEVKWRRLSIYMYLLNIVGQKNKKKLKQLIFENLNTTDKISTKNLKQYTLDFSEVY